MTLPICETAREIAAQFAPKQRTAETLIEMAAVIEVLVEALEEARHALHAAGQNYTARGIADLLTKVRQS